MATLYRNWTVTVQDSQSPYSPVSNLELHLFEGKVEIKTDPATGLKKVFTYGTSTLATYAVDSQEADAVALAADSTTRPGEYDFLSLDLNNATKTPASKAGETLYSVVGKPAGAADFSSGRVIIDSTSLDDPNVKQTLANLGGGLTSVTDNIFFAGGTVQHTLYTGDGFLTNTAAVLHIKLTNLPADIVDLTEQLLLPPPYYNAGSLPADSLVLIPRFNVYYTDETTIVARWKAVRAYVMSDGSIALRLRADQYSIYRTNEFGSGGGQLDLLGVETSLIVSVDVEDQNTHYRSFNKNPQYPVNISGPEGVMVSAYQSNGIENVGIGQWGFSNVSTDMPVAGIDLKHTRGIRASANTKFRNQFFVEPGGILGRIGVNTDKPKAKFHIEAGDDADDPMPIFNAGRHAETLAGGSVAIGDYAESTAAHAMALGRYCKATAFGALSLGYQSQATNVYAVAMGYQAIASGQYSVAIGAAITVSANYSVGISLNGTAKTVAEANVLCISGGRVGIGTTAGATVFTPVLLVSDSDTPSVGFYRHHNGVSGDDDLGTQVFYGKNAGADAIGARIIVRAYSAWASPAFPAYMSFHTRSTTDTGTVERVRITQDGVLHVGYGGALTGPLVTLQSSTYPTGALEIKYTTLGGDAYMGLYYSYTARVVYLGATQGLSVNNLNVFSNGTVGIGHTVSLACKLGVHTTAYNLIATFSSDLSVNSYIGVLNSYGLYNRYAYLSIYNNAGLGSTVSLGVNYGVNADNLNIRYAVSGSDTFLGFGTSNPLSKMDIAGGVTIGSYAGVTAAPLNCLTVSARIGIGTPAPLSYPLHIYSGVSAILALLQTTGTSGGLELRTTSGSAFMQASSGMAAFGTVASTNNGIWIDANGNVGVKTAAIVTGMALHVAGTIYAQDNIDYPTALAFRRYSGTSAEKARLTLEGAFCIGATAHGSAWLRVCAVGYTNIYTGLLIDGTIDSGTVAENHGINITSTFIGAAITTIQGVRIGPTITGTCTNYFGIGIGNPGGGGSILNCYGLYIEALNRGSVTNYAAYFGSKIHAYGGIIAGDVGTGATANCVKCKVFSSTLNASTVGQCVLTGVPTGSICNITILLSHGAGDTKFYPPNTGIAGNTYTAYVTRDAATPTVEFENRTGAFAAQSDYVISVWYVV